jgi:arylsulfatase A-like enzyme
MPIRFLAFATLLLGSAPIACEADDSEKAAHVVVVVWDGMRPDLITSENTPTLSALVRSGVIFKRNHAAYPSSTNVNGAVLATGVTPGHSGIIANLEFWPAIDPLKPFDTSDFPALDRNPEINAKHLGASTVAEILHTAGHWTAVAGAKPVAQFFDRSRRRTSEAAIKSTVVFRGKILSDDAGSRITKDLGPFPVRKTFPNRSEDDWTTRVLTDVLWGNEVPKFSLLWLSEPDLTQHETALGTPAAMLAIRNSDHNLARVLAALKAKNALTKTDIFVVSDHGFSTIYHVADVAAVLRKAGFDAVRAFSEKPKRGQILVVSLGGSVSFYVVDHERALIEKLIDFLARSDFAGVILTREKNEGTFTFAQTEIDAPAAPDVVVACRWNDQSNEFGIAGQIASDIGRSNGHGSHSTLSPHDVKNTLIASGPDFRRGWSDETPSGNIDLAPTILWILGVKTLHPMDGRILREALIDAHEKPVVAEKTIEAQRNLGGAVWRQHLRTATVDGVTYFSEGDGSSAPPPP